MEGLEKFVINKGYEINIVKKKDFHKEIRVIGVLVSASEDAIIVKRRHPFKYTLINVENTRNRTHLNYSNGVPILLNGNLFVIKMEDGKIIIKEGYNVVNYVRFSQNDYKSIYFGLLVKEGSLEYRVIDTSKNLSLNISIDRNNMYIGSIDKIDCLIAKTGKFRLPYLNFIKIELKNIYLVLLKNSFPETYVFNRDRKLERILGPTYFIPIF